jgi:hypothetical protein
MMGFCVLTYLYRHHAEFVYISNTFGGDSLGWHVTFLPVHLLNYFSYRNALVIQRARMNIQWHEPASQLLGRLKWEDYLTPEFKTSLSNTARSQLKMWPRNPCFVPSFRGKLLSFPFEYEVSYQLFINALYQVWQIPSTFVLKGF